MCLFLALFLLIPSYVLTCEHGHGDLSAEQKNELLLSWGVDPDQRRQRLTALAYQTAPKPSAAQQMLFQQNLAKIPYVITQRPPDDTLPNLFEINNDVGITEYLFHGDIHLTESQLSSFEGTQGRRKRQVSSTANKWANNTVFYFLDPSINDRKKISIAAALEYIQTRTCVRFIESATATNRIRVFSGSGCYSSVGMCVGQQDLSLGNGCEPIGTVAHEFTHALGAWHMQMRSDRDSFITVDLKDVPTNRQGNFGKLGEGDMINPSYTPYEYGSYMQYAANAFSSHIQNLSMVPADPRYAYTMGNQYISFYDIKMINDHYGCSVLCPPSTSAKCVNGGLPNPQNCSSCNCPAGYGGPLCDQRPSGCGAMLTANATWQSFRVSIGNSSDTSVRDVFTLCNHWITAPPGTQIQVQLTSMYNQQCQYGCPYAGIEFKVETDQRVTNPRYCCPEFYNQIINSTLNPMPVISFNRFYYSTFTFDYRYVEVPTTTTTTTPKPPVPGNKCMNMLSDAQCDGNVAEGFCNRTEEYSFQKRKYNCAGSCGLCGKAATPCVDQNSGCYRSLCSSMHPMDAEFWCAKTCGFCDSPN